MSLLPPGTPVPPFSASASDGHIYTERDLAGRRILLVFLRGIGRRHGERQLREMQRGTERLRSAGVEIFAVASESRATLQQLANAAGCEFPLLSDERKALAKAFGVPGRFSLRGSAWFLIGDGEVIFSHLQTNRSQPVNVDEIYARLIGLAATHARR